jgi:hypothetical protein
MVLSTRRKAPSIAIMIALGSAVAAAYTWQHRAQLTVSPTTTKPVPVLRYRGHSQAVEHLVRRR